MPMETWFLTAGIECAFALKTTLLTCIKRRSPGHPWRAFPTFFDKNFNMKIAATTLIGLAVITGFVFPKNTAAQNLPDEWRMSDDGKRLIIGGNETKGFFDESVIHSIELWFDEPNYWTLLTNNYQSGTDLGALMIVDGDTLESEVGVHFKGQTSYQQTQGEQKKSFNITLDFADENQDIEGYETLNLNNGFQDPSFMRELLYLHLSRRHNPSLKGNYAQLFINGENWGPYPCVQGLDGDFLKEWFLSSDGTRWRALKTIGGGGPGSGGTGGPFGTGYSSLNWLNTSDTSEYKKFYTLKKTHKENPWEDLVKTCDKLGNTPLAALEDSIKLYMDLDRTLWFLATEIIFADDDGYAHKGGMDYYLYWEPETGRMVPLEYDGNSAMLGMNINWSPFYNQNDDRFVLMNRLFAVPAIRQRYLAHVRTMMEESFVQTDIEAAIDNYFEMVGPLVQDDSKYLYTYNQFVTEKENLKNLFQQRRNNILANTEVAQQGLDISNVNYSSQAGEWTAPQANESVTVTAQIGGAAGIHAANLYYGTGLVGVFSKTTMHDDGAHGDGAANDGIFGAEIPGQGNGVYVRFYMEAIAANTPKTASYLPKGAEHDVYVYRVGTTDFVASDVVINEIMASNETTASDQDGEFDDWIELYNNSSSSMDLSGWFLSDKSDDLQKWSFPTGTFIEGNGYLVVWADENGSQAGLHANFKLSASGESLYLVDPNLAIAQEIIFGEQTTDMGYARVPNGTGDFVIQPPTFGANNDLLNAVEDLAAHAVVDIYPNPASGAVFIKTNKAQGVALEVLNTIGQRLFLGEIFGQAWLDVAQWPAGVYWVKVGDETRKLVVE
jgi:spore coat protein CotH